MVKVVIDTQVRVTVDMDEKDYKDYMLLVDSPKPDKNTEIAINALAGLYINNIAPDAFSTLELVE